MICIVFVLLLLCCSTGIGRALERAILKTPDGNYTCNRGVDDTRLSQLEMEVAQYGKNLKSSLKGLERVLFFRFLLKSKFYFEFGCSSSTIFACEYFPDINMRCVDANMVSINSIRNNTCVNSSMEDGRLSMRYINIGEVSVMGKPLNYDRIRFWGDYSEAIKRIGHAADFVFIDGRFRIASALKAILYTNPSKTVILIHDFFARPEYYVVLKYTNVVDCEENLVVLRPKGQINRVELHKDITMHNRNVF